MIAKATLQYIVGFVLSLLLTLGAYSLVVAKILSGRWLILGVLFLALVQLFVQLIFFLHLGRESRPKWNLTLFSFAVLVVVIIVWGSVWIMDNLDYHHGHQMTPSETEKYIIEDEGIKY